MRDQERAGRRVWHEKCLGGPEPYEAYTFERFNPDLNNTHRILKACLDFDPTKGNLFILGPQGTGKTHLSTAIARRVLDSGGRARVFYGEQLAAQLRGKKSYATEYDRIDALADLAEINVIVIDDIENGPEREGYWSSLKVLLDQRKNQRRFGFIVTSNKTLAELNNIVGPKVADRLEGDFKHLVIPPTTPSARRLLKQQMKPQK